MSADPQLSSEAHQPSLLSSINKLIVFDWDDTLFPTTAIKKLEISKKGYLSVSAEDHMQLKELSYEIYHALSTCILQYGAPNIRIVTASEKGWIKRSLSIVYKIGRFADVYDILFIKSKIIMIHPPQQNLPFVSQKQVFEWKYSIFTILLRDSHLTNDCKATVNTFMSFGDSIHEYKAAKCAADVYQNVLVHRVKFLPRPSISDVIDQMKFLHNFMKLSDMSSTRDGSDIEIDCRPTEIPCSNPAND
eukprot:119447_1